jgi:glycosyltransferase involved in cell wall biosynthesis
MPEFFKTADVLLVPLKSDPVFSMTIPGKVQTCLATGLPVLGMLDGEGARVIEESGGGHAVAAGDAAGLAEQVMRLMSLSAEERQAMGALGRRYALSEFNRQALIDRLEVTLKTMIASV